MTDPQNPGTDASQGHPDNGKAMSVVDRLQLHPMFFAFLVLGAIFVLYQVGGGIITFIIAGGAVPSTDNVLVMRLLTMFGQIALILLPTVVFARMFTNRLSTVFPVRVPTLLETTYALVALFALQRILEVYLALQDQLPLPEYVQQLLTPLREMMQALVKVLVGASSVPELLFVVLVVALVPATVEELLFRGLIQRSFERVLSPFVSAVLAGTIFGLFHLNPFELVPLMVLGIFFGVLRLRSQTMLLPMGAHFLNNLMAVLAYYFGIDQPLPPGAPNPMASAGMLIMQFLFFGTLFAVTFLAYLRSTDVWHIRLPGAGE
jgi:membrane protease YdiL (CAAX protease family)